MEPAEVFCSQLLDEGRVVFAERPETPQTPSSAALAVLSRAFHTERLRIAGALIPFDECAAWEAAELVRQAAWAAVCHEESAKSLGRRLAMTGPPHTPGAHLSADLMLRYLPQIHRRVRALGPADPLVENVANVLRQWPLSGVLSDVREPPTTPLDFAGHEGLMLCYAERLVAHDRAGWVPEGKAREYAALVFQERGRELRLAEPEACTNA